MFRLTRYFSLASLAAMIAAAVLLGGVYRLVATNEMVRAGEHHTVDQAHLFSNSMGALFLPIVKRSAQLDTQALRSDPALNDLDAQVRRLAKGLTVMKVKIYGPDMRTVYSSDPTQIGQDASGNKAVRSALAGTAVTELVYRDRFNAFDGMVENSDVLQSYVPVTDPADGRIVAVFELYENVSEFAQRVRRTQWLVIAGVLVVLVALYAAQLLIVSRADRIIRAQIEEQHRAHAELHAAKEAAEAADRAKALFLANMSHQLRTPMNGIVGMTDLALLDPALSEDSRDALRTVIASSRELLSMFDKVLAYADIEAGKVVLAPRPFPVAALVNELAHRYAARARDAGLSFAVRVGPEVPAMLACDPERIEQALNQFLDNALAFTRRGGIELSLAVREQSPERVTVEFSVRDTGIGIARERQQAVFRAFALADESSTRRQGGTGLGLAVCAKLAELMGGTVECDSTPGAGSTFRLIVPLGRVDAAG